MEISNPINEVYEVFIDTFKGRLMLVLDDKERTTVITSDSYTHTVRERLNL